MKFYEKMDALRRGLFLSEIEREAAEQVRERQAVLARERAEFDALHMLEQDCAQRLAPHVGRLMLITNFKGQEMFNHPYET